MRKISDSLRVGAVSFMAAGLLLSAGRAAHAQITPYYIAAGDQDRVTIVQNGALVGTFDSSAAGIGYAIAIRNTIWLGDRDDNGAVEYTLAGTPTGNTSVGGNNFTQLLDGTTNGTTNNYGALFNGGAGTQAVTVANLDWSGQVVLFTLPFNPGGITYDTSTDHLFISPIFSTNIFEYDLAGNQLNVFNAGVSTISLAYEQATDTLWSATNGGNTIFQISKTGAVLQTLVIAGADFGNNFGGEMPINVSAPAAAPEPGTLALLGATLLPVGLAVVRRRRRK